MYDPEVLGDRYLAEQAILRKMAKDAFLREAREEQWEYTNGY